MGQAILYCFKCSTQLREAQFEKGKAFRVDGWVTCADCAPELAKTLPKDRVPLLKDMIAGKHLKPVTPPPMRDSRLSITPAAFPWVAADSRPKWPLFAGVGLAVVAVLAATTMMGRSSPPPPEEYKAPPPPVAVKPPPPVAPAPPVA